MFIIFMFLKKIFESNKISENQYKTAQIITANIINRDLAYVLAHPEKKYNIIERIKINQALNKLKKNIPLAYIFGNNEFYGLTFFVNKHTLIPRPETETMVETSIQIMKNLRDKKIFLIDIGTGTGCIPISILKKSNHANLRAIAIDKSRRALRIAKKNSKKHNLKIDFLHGDLFLPILDNPTLIADCSNMLITANLPYLTAKQFASEKSIQHEPKIALVSDNSNGLFLYDKLFEQISSFLSHVNYPINILIEIDPRQSKDAVLLAGKYFSKAKIEIKKDLAGHDRLVAIEAWPNLKQ